MPKIRGAGCGISPGSLPTSTEAGEVSCESWATGPGPGVLREASEPVPEALIRRVLVDDPLWSSWHSAN